MCIVFADNEEWLCFHTPNSTEPRFLVTATVAYATASLYTTIRLMCVRARACSRANTRTLASDRRSCWWLLCAASFKHSIPYCIYRICNLIQGHAFSRVSFSSSLPICTRNRQVGDGWFCDLWCVSVVIKLSLEYIFHIKYIYSRDTSFKFYLPHPHHSQE